MAGGCRSGRARAVALVLLGLTAVICAWVSWRLRALLWVPPRLWLSLPVRPLAAALAQPLAAGDLVAYRHTGAAVAIARAFVGARTTHAALVVGADAMGRTLVAHAVGGRGVVVAPLVPQAHCNHLVIRRLAWDQGAQATAQTLALLRQRIARAAVSAVGAPFSHAYILRGAGQVMGVEAALAPLVRRLEQRGTRAPATYCTRFIVDALAAGGALVAADAQLWTSDELVAEGARGARKALAWLPGLSWGRPERIIVASPPHARTQASNADHSCSLTAECLETIAAD
jgi:hypothetical protein